MTKQTINTLIDLVKTDYALTQQHISALSNTIEDLNEQIKSMMAKSTTSDGQMQNVLDQHHEMYILRCEFEQRLDDLHLAMAELKSL